MSLILEALRKSEAERRRGLAPDVAMELPPAPAARPRTLLAWLLPALVVAALLVFGGWWAKRDSANTVSPEAVVETRDTASSSTNPAPHDMPRIAPTPTAPAMASVPANDIPAPVVQTPATIVAPPPDPTTTSTPATSVASTRPAPIQSTSIQPPKASPLPPPASDISNDTSSLPPIKLSMLMWDEVPSRRFVILNGQRMLEGDRAGELSVVAIERNAVVVERNGAKARVPLP